MLNNCKIELVDHAKWTRVVAFFCNLLKLRQLCHLVGPLPRYALYMKGVPLALPVAEVSVSFYEQLLRKKINVNLRDSFAGKFITRLMHFLVEKPLSLRFRMPCIKITI